MSSLDQFLTLKEPFHRIEPQERNRCSAYCRERNNHPSLQQKMVSPLLLARVKERDNFFCLWVGRCHIAPLIAIAKHTSIGQIALYRSAAMFASQNVVNLMGSIAVVFADQAILAPPGSSVLNLPPELRRNVLAH